MPQTQIRTTAEVVHPVVFSHPDSDSREAVPWEQSGTVDPRFVPSLTPLGEGWDEHAPAWRPARPSAPRGDSGRDPRGRDGYQGRSGSGRSGGARAGSAQRQSSRGRSNGWGGAG
ncbi:hypothetical protein KCV87_05190 [Actinosynnema pretiosum subsp. pretiosum]|uniref:Uncharacterized protein n=2 Tax=Actinosynnema TaxID=40566 RepID=C6WRP1_ACTMD|nr:hypothetical protein [Actinosynnema mirum]ACU36883.1 hypothetical protein Amir_2962 [Actinosynnema mirum DSM 43827]AXX30351.1 hypothetical protein APASM_2986 [Actinosynnema pretiosum subsp. pretiosum]QUF05499.1 hypothetical protein KCV87_05190 [Actinosynnema pretiosum subsp. pretiosum]